jgi:hypothetical protein
MRSGLQKPGTQTVPEEQIAQALMAKTIYPEEPERGDKSESEKEI